ncbi:hypothetical protein BAJUN_01090 [Bajunvirus bajun]|uniref:Uncharacterized protein n=1 Tax=Brevundimonas phage vB_BgoS-Bajun TaxID=2948594 RepID=A0A9E7N4R0_9CAUD|nr:hypothetical protein BAJUN_01090 [Brevundimonas phage vB_BgoS-Bajun]
MSDRPKGPYWVKREGGVWEIATWEGSWWRTFEDFRRQDDDMTVIGPRILNPDEAP